MRILLTRPDRYNDELRVRLEALGHHVISSAMIEIVPLNAPMIQLGDVQGIIVTSRNALHAIKNTTQISEVRKLRLYAVGEATSRTARAMGFTDIVTGPGRASELAEMVNAQANPRDGRFLHFRGENVAFDFYEALLKHGFETEPIVVYRAVFLNSLNDQAMDAIKAGELEAVLLLSPRTAQAFTLAITAAGLGEEAIKLTYACISQSTARELAALDARDVRIAARPTADEMVATINLISAQSHN